MVLWFQQDFTPGQSAAVMLSVVMLALVGVIVLAWVSDVYRLLPGWGPVRKFDHQGTEDMRVRQVLIHQHAATLQDGMMQQQYGTIESCKGGVCEAPNKRVILIDHPEHGRCKLHEGFAETQHMRAEC